MLELAARTYNLREAKGLIAEGFKYLEITLPCPGGPAEELAWAELAREHGTRFLGHGPNEGDPQDLVGLKNRYLPQLHEGLQAGARLGCLGLTVHFWLESRWLRPEVITTKINYIAQVAAWGAALGVPVNLENLSEGPRDLEAAFSIISDIGLTLDLGHAQIMQPVNIAPEIIDRLFPRLRHIHLHDNQGGKSPKDDLHWPPGRGSVPFATIFSELKRRDYQGTATLEVAFSEMVTARDWVQQAWEKA